MQSTRSELGVGFPQGRRCQAVSLLKPTDEMGAIAKAAFISYLSDGMVRIDHLPMR